VQYSNYAVFCLVLCLTHLVQGITGFGAVVLALPVLVYFFPLKTLIPALIVVNLLQALWFAVTEREHIHRRHALSIGLLSLAGLPLGWAVYQYLPADQLKLALGVFVVVVAVYNLAGIKSPVPVPQRLYHLLNFLGGVTQGALASGGPFLVIYAARMLEHKSAFRATLSVVWTLLNFTLCVTYALSGSFQTDQVPLLALALPCVAFGTVLGNALHRRMPMKPFRTLIFLVLLFSGLILLRPLLGWISPP